MATAQVLPKELRLSAPPTMPQARSYLFKQQSVLSLYEPGNNNVVTINLPRLQRSYLTKDSYLKFRMGISWKNGAELDKLITLGSPTAPCFDTPGAFGLFDRIEVYDYLGSTLLESTSGHGQLMALLMDTQSSTDELAFHYATSSGTKGGKSTDDLDTKHEYDSMTENITDANWAPSPNPVLKQLIGSNSGQQFHRIGNIGGLAVIPPTDPVTTYPTGAIGNVANDGSVAGITYYEFAIPLFSFLGLLSQKFAPLHNGYTINLTLNSAAVALGFANPYGTTAYLETDVPPVTYQLNNIYLCAQVLELGPVAESMLISSTQGQPFVVPSKAYRNYIGNITQQSSAYRLDLNLNVASLTNILWIMRDTSYLNDVRYRNLSYRIRNHLQSWFFQYGSTILPQTSGIQCCEPTGVELDQNRGGYNEAYCELMKARHNLNAANFNSNISKRNFWIDKAADGATQDFIGTSVTNRADRVMRLSADSPYECGKFAAGLDLELVSGRSNDLVCGMNTNGMNTSINLTFHPSYTNEVVSSRVDCWCEYDSFINVSPGIATTVSF